jgi:GDP-L-fucose synthase
MSSPRRVFVAGHGGMVGSALVRLIEAQAWGTVVTADRESVDLREQAQVREFMRDARPDLVIAAAARVGGILANHTRPAEFIGENLMIQTNLIHEAWAAGTEKFVFLGSSCIYPREAPQPIEEGSLLTGPLEPTNEWYAVAKIAGIKMAQAYRRQYGFSAVSVMPTNLYGPGDNFDPDESHVVPALIRRFHEAKEAGASEVVVWGSGTPLREFLHVDDLAEAVLFVADEYDGEEPLNIGSGAEVTIAELARMIADVVGFEGDIRFDSSKPDGTPRKRLDCGRLKDLGWQASTGLREGLQQTYAWFLGRVKAHEGVRGTE